MNKDEVRDQVFVSAKQIKDQIEVKKRDLQKLKEEINVLIKLEINSEEIIKKTCFKNPKSGDVWYKNKDPLLCVVEVLDNEEIVVCDEISFLSEGKYSFDVEKIKKIKIQEFFEAITENSNFIKYDVLPKEYTMGGLAGKK